MAIAVNRSQPEMNTSRSIRTRSYFPGNYEPLSPRLDFDPSGEDSTPLEKHIGIPVGELSQIISDIRELAHGDELDEDGPIRPSQHAIRTTVQLLFGAFPIPLMLSSDFGHKGYVTTDTEGGIRIEWSKQGTSLRLVVAGSPKGKSYVYYEFGNKFGSERNVTSDVLKRLLSRYVSH